jgi:hypothetical protein
MEITLVDGVKILVLDASIYNTLSKTERGELMVKYGCTKVHKSDTETSTRSADHITPEMINWRNGMTQNFNKQTSGTKFMIGVDGYKYVPQLTFRKSGKNPASAAEVELVDNLAGLGKDKTTK